VQRQYLHCFSEPLQAVASILKSFKTIKEVYGTNKEIKTYYQDPAGASIITFINMLFQSKKSDFYVDEDDFLTETNSLVYHKMTS
jgi:hypothetical protein